MYIIKLSFKSNDRHKVIGYTKDKLNLLLSYYMHSWLISIK